MFDYPKNLDYIFDKLLSNNIRPIIVGGFVRDFFLKIDSKDIDVELYGVTSLEHLEKILVEFGSINNVGKSFGICKLTAFGIDLDFSLPRLDSKVAQGHKGFKVEIHTSLDFKTATSRRDFTVNAMGYDVQNKIFLDPFNGLEDLHNHILRAVNVKKFSQDPLRVLRAVQMCARFNMTLETQLFMICQNMVHKRQIEELPKERIFGEIQKLLLKSNHISIGIKLLQNLGLFQYFTELQKLDAMALTNTSLALDRCSQLKHTDIKKELILKLSVLCHALSLKDTQSFLYSLTQNRKLIKNVLLIIQTEKKFNLKAYTTYHIYVLATQIAIEDFVLFLQSLYPENNQQIEDLRTKALELGVYKQALLPLINGQDLLKIGFTPSPQFKSMLDNIYKQQFQGKIQTKKEALSFIKNVYK